ncbi:hypothetical protein BCR34DRAFT_49656 [Clohesyomyces aquaticus]|uniref:Uncharacterized protein n=1 Tax=Clohesyomyces aquaticus TaxID=1231657 RepID=A0A1Y1Z4F3_9PLEO|nr:hypothetical protein BCR34DRAFT_49656 [Clohesyomyces aquaticus]
MPDPDLCGFNGRDSASQAELKGAAASFDEERASYHSRSRPTCKVGCVGGARGNSMVFAWTQVSSMPAWFGGNGQHSLSSSVVSHRPYRTLPLEPRSRDLATTHYFEPETTQCEEFSMRLPRRSYLEMDFVLADWHLCHNTSAETDSHILRAFIATVQYIVNVGSSIYEVPGCIQNAQDWLEID